MQHTVQGGRDVKGSCCCSRMLTRGWIWRNERGDIGLHAAVRVGDAQFRLFVCLLLFAVANVAVCQACCGRVCRLPTGTGLPWQFCKQNSGQRCRGGRAAMLLQQGWGLEGWIKRGETSLFAAVRVTDAKVEGLHYI
jgi:hypothetical protein